MSAADDEKRGADRAGEKTTPPSPPSPPSESVSSGEDFSTFYDREISDALQAIEQQRRTLVRRAIVLCVAGVSALLIGLLAPIEEPFFRIVLIGIAACVFLAAWLAMREAHQRVKRFLVRKLCTFFGLEYSAYARAFPLNWFARLQIVPNHDRAGLEDHMTGTHADVAIQVCDGHLEERYTTRDAKTGKTRTHYRTVFRGLLCYFSFPKTFKGRTIITGDRGAIGNWFTNFSMPGEPVHLEDPRFESYFSVYSTDQVEARYLLTPGFMERVLAFSSKVGPYGLRMAFDAQHLLISLNSGRDYFEAGSAFGNATDPARIAELHRELQIIFEMIDTLGLALKTRV